MSEISYDALDKSVSLSAFIPSVMVTLLTIISDGMITPYMRNVSEYVDGPSITHPLLPQTVSLFQLYVYSIVRPAVTITVLCAIFRKWDLLRISLLGFCEATAISVFITTAAKKMAGSLRPNFYALCGWNGTACTGPQIEVMSAYQSFPSGHASGAGAGLTYLALFLCHLAAAHPIQTRFHDACLQLMRLGALLPVLFAVWIAITRTIDYFHRFEDITAGLALGVGAAFASAAGRLRP
jgi:diacylglycerol diphosphate phosphatase/phosphatidate phosphatase